MNRLYVSLSRISFSTVSFCNLIDEWKWVNKTTNLRFLWGFPNPKRMWMYQKTKMWISKDGWYLSYLYYFSTESHIIYGTFYSTHFWLWKDFRFYRISKFKKQWSHIISSFMTLAQFSVCSKTSNLKNAVCVTQ